MTEVVETITRYRANDGRLFAKKEDCERHEYLVTKFKKDRVGCETVKQLFTDEELDCVWVENENDLNEYYEYVKHNCCQHVFLATSSVIARDKGDCLPTFVLCYYDHLDDEYYIGTISQYYNWLEDVADQVGTVRYGVDRKYHLYLH